ncbi:MAG: STAS domain-containing protein [Hylemonella sp.]|nr:STAS domain-containing protein [Hylemonella sp.]
MTDQFELPSELTIYSAARTHNELLAWASRQVGSGSDIKLSARAVESVDGAGLQLLVSLGQTNESWRLVDASEVFADACRVMGFADWLDAPRFQPDSTREIP